MLKLFIQTTGWRQRTLKRTRFVPEFPQQSLLNAWRMDYSQLKWTLMTQSPMCVAQSNFQRRVSETAYAIDINGFIQQLPADNSVQACGRLAPEFVEGSSTGRVIIARFADLGHDSRVEPE
jgi:hypothetical protein